MALTSILNDFVTRSGLIVQGTGTVTSSTAQSGAVQINGGAAIAKNLIVGTTATIHGPTTIYGQLYLDNTLVVVSTATFLGTTNLSAVSVANGNFTGQLTVAQTSTFNGPIIANSISTFNGPVFVTGTNSLNVATGPTNLGGALNVAGIATFNNTTPAAANGTGAVVIAGGQYIGNNLVVASTLTSFVTTASNSIYTLGGIGVTRDLIVGGNMVVSGNISVLGTQTTINSTATIIQDPVIDIGVGQNNQPLAVNDGLNKGIVLHYYDTQYNQMFLGRNNLTGRLVLKNNLYSSTVGIDNPNYVNSGTFAGFDVGNIVIWDSAQASNTVTGALQVVGGGGFGDSVYAGNYISGGTVRARNLTQNRLVFSTTNGQLTDNANLTVDTGTGQIVGTIYFANTATNIAGGAAGSLFYQTAPGVTTTLPLGSLGYVLLAGASAPYWGTLGEVVTGFSNTSTNLAGGFAGAVPYQSNTGTTAFTSNFTWNAGNNTLSILKANITSTDNAVSTTTAALVVSGGVGIGKDLRVGADLYVDGQIYMRGVGLNTISASTGTFDFIISEGTGTGLDVYYDANIRRNLRVAGTGTFTTLVVLGQSTLGNVTAGVITGTDLTVPGLSTLGTVNITTATIAFLTATNLTISGSITTPNVNVVNLSVSGATTLAETTATKLTVTGQSILGPVQATVITGTTLTISGAAAVGNLSAAVTTVTSLTVTGNTSIGGAFTATGAATLSSSLTVGTTATINGKLLVTDTTNAVGTPASGSIQTLGGVGVTKDVYVGGAITAGATLAGTPNQVVPALYSNNLLLSSYTSSSISGSTKTSLDAYSTSTYRTSKYLVQITDGANFHVTEVAVFHNGTNVYFNEYGMFYNNGSLGSFDAEISGGNVVLTFTPTSASAMVIKVVRMTISV